MSQHDYDIANQAGAAFRADLNGALQAIATNNSGGTALTTPFAYQFWADTNAGLLKMRNGANNAWITIGSLGVANLGHVLPGTVAFHAKNTAPSGWLKANGGAVSRTTYADLFAEIGTTFGAGDGSTTFNVPDLRGEFPRGWDDSRGVDSGRAFGSAQSGLVGTHVHDVIAVNVAAPGSGVTTLNPTGSLTGGSGFIPGSGTGLGSENRPRNIALLACIKF